MCFELTWVGGGRWGFEGWGSKGGGSNGGGPKGGGPKISRFFSLSRRKIRSFLPSLGGSFRGILVVFEAPGRSNVHVWSSRGVVCEPRRPGLVWPPGFHTTVRESKRAHLRVPAFKKTTKIQREDTQRGKKRTNFAAGQGKKSEILGGPGEGLSSGGRSREGRSREGRFRGHRT